jgi:hypothetical protein
MPVVATLQGPFLRIEHRTGDGNAEANRDTGRQHKRKRKKETGTKRERGEVLIVQTYNEPRLSWQEGADGRGRGSWYRHITSPVCLGKKGPMGGSWYGV